MLAHSGVLDVNKAYPSLLNLLPDGLKGLSFAALTAAIVASLAGKVNSIATIFTLDVYKKAIKPEATDRQLVILGKYSVAVAMLLGFILACILGNGLMGEGKQGFQYIQEYTGFVSPGIFAMFILGFFWKKTTSNAALFATIGGFILSVAFKFLPYMVNLKFLASTGFSKLNGTIYEMPFLDRMGFVFIICVTGMYFISKRDNAKGITPNGLEIDASMFKTSKGFAWGAIIVCAIITVLYSIFW